MLKNETSLLKVTRRVRIMLAPPDISKWCSIAPRSQPCPTNNNTTTVTVDKPLVVFTDGSCLHNGKPNARAGYAVVFPDHHPEFTEYAALPRGGDSTNNRAELTACVRALEIARDQLDPFCFRQVVIYTDSQLLINSITKWLPNWKRNNWIKSTDKKPVLNRDLLEKIDQLRQERGERNVAFRYVAAHTGKKDWQSEWNARVDSLARQAAVTACAS